VEKSRVLSSSGTSTTREGPTASSSRVLARPPPPPPPPPRPAAPPPPRPPPPPPSLPCRQVITPGGQPEQCSRDVALIYYLTQGWQEAYGGVLVDCQTGTRCASWVLYASPTRPLHALCASSARPLHALCASSARPPRVLCASSPLGSHASSRACPQHMTSGACRAAAARCQVPGAPGVHESEESSSPAPANSLAALTGQWLLALVRYCGRASCVMCALWWRLYTHRYVPKFNSLVAFLVPRFHEVV
jgi:hypothetical protein